MHENNRIRRVDSPKRPLSIDNSMVDWFNWKLSINRKKTCNEVDGKKENTKRIESNARERMRKGRNGSGLIEEKEQKANKSEHIEKEKKKQIVH